MITAVESGNTLQVFLNSNKPVILRRAGPALISESRGWAIYAPLHHVIEIAVQVNVSDIRQPDDGLSADTGVVSP